MAVMLVAIGNIAALLAAVLVLAVTVVVTRANFWRLVP
jgi:hypothetical protein